MANAVQWIKITTDIFDDEKILFIDTLPNANDVLVIWFKLLCLAGKQNNKGVFMIGNKPYTVKMLATVLRRDEESIENALKIFEEYGMVTYVDRVITITNWGKHQSLDKLEYQKEYMRDYMREYRKKQKNVAEGKTEGKVNGKLNHKVKINSADIDKDKELDKELDKRLEKENMLMSSCDDESVPFNYEKVVSLFNSICKSLPRVTKLTSKREKTILSASKVLGEKTFESLFEKVEQSDFLTGRNGQWKCSFDWIIKQENIVKILEGNYDNRKSAPKEDYTSVAKYENMNMEV